MGSREKPIEKTLDESKQLRELKEAAQLRERKDFAELVELKERARKQEQEIKRLSELSETQRKFIELAEAAKSGDLTKERRSQLQRAIDLLKSCLNNWSIDSTVRELIDASKAVDSGLESSTFEALRSDYAFRNTKGASNFIGKQLNRLVETSRSLVCFLGSGCCVVRDGALVAENAEGVVG